MKFSSIPSLASLLAVASATYPPRYHIQYEPIVCTDPAPYTVTETVTVTECSPLSQATQPPYIVTDGPTITSIDYNADQTTIWVYPTGSANHDATVAVYSSTTVISVVIVNISITIINGSPVTVTSTITDRSPTYTPTLPLPTTWTGPPSTGPHTPPYQTGTSSTTSIPYSSGGWTYTPYPSGSISRSISSSSTSSSYSTPTESTTLVIGTGGMYSTGYPAPAPTYYPVNHPRRAAAWFA